MDNSADRDAGDPERAVRRRGFLAAGGALALGGLLTGCNFSHGAGTGESSTTSGPSAGASSNPLSAASSNSSS